MVCRQLIVQPDVLNRQPKLLEQMEDEFQLRIHQRLTSDAAVESGYANQRLPIQNGNGDLSAEEFEFFFNPGIGKSFFTFAPENSALAKEEAANAGFEGQFKMFEQAGRQPDGASRTQPAPCFNRGPFAKSAEGVAQENGGAINGHNLPKLQKKLPQHRFRPQRVRQNGREIAQHL